MSQKSPNKVYGKNAVLECLDSDISVNKVWLQKINNPRLKEIEQKARAKKIPVIKLDKKDLDKLAGTDEHRSVLAEISPVELKDESYLLEPKVKKILIPVNIEDPHNLGAIIRSAHAFGVDAVALAARKTSPITQTVISSSAGAAFKLPLVRIGNISQCIEKLKQNKFWIYAASSDGEGESLDKIKFDEHLVLLVGNEASGIPQKLSEHCDFKLYIPIEFESLNVSVATGIFLYKIWTSRTTTNHSD